jgi:AcrR family transcriptional regulator
MGRPPRPELHDALLDAARGEFAARGLERARVEDVARRAGVSKGAFYLHFASKEEAFEEILQRFMGAMEDQALRREEAELAFRQDNITTPEAELRHRQVEFDCAAEIGILETLWRNRHVLAVIEGVGGSRYHRAVSDFRRRMQAFVTARMAEKQASGWIRKDLDAALMGDIIVGTYEGFARRMAAMNDRPDLESWLRSFVHICYEGMLDRPGAGTRAPRSTSAGGARRATRASVPRPARPRRRRAAAAARDDS